jgi:hypothetical protein
MMRIKTHPYVFTNLITCGSLTRRAFEADARLFAP